MGRELAVREALMVHNSFCQIFCLVSVLNSFWNLSEFTQIIYLPIQLQSWTFCYMFEPVLMCGRCVCRSCSSCRLPSSWRRRRSVVTKSATLWRWWSDNATRSSWRASRWSTRSWRKCSEWSPWAVTLSSSYKTPSTPSLRESPSGQSQTLCSPIWSR